MWARELLDDGCRLSFTSIERLWPVVFWCLWRCFLSKQPMKTQWRQACRRLRTRRERQNIHLSREIASREKNSECGQISFLCPVSKERFKRAENTVETSSYGVYEAVGDDINSWKPPHARKKLSPSQAHNKLDCLLAKEQFMTINWLVNKLISLKSFIELQADVILDDCRKDEQFSEDENWRVFRLCPIGGRERNSLILTQRRKNEKIAQKRKVRIAEKIK